jgi:hypothetical protein
MLASLSEADRPRRDGGKDRRADATTSVPMRKIPFKFSRYRRGKPARVLAATTLPGKIPCYVIWFTLFSCRQH